MKKGILVLLCLLLCALIVGGGAAWLLLTPRGLLRQDRPEDVMQSAVSSMRREDWRAEYVRQRPAAVSEFEDAERVTGDIFDAAVPTGVFSFRQGTGEVSDREERYIVTGDGVDLFEARLTYDTRHWNLALTALDTLSAPTRTISVTVPEDASVTLNGRRVDERYIVERGIPYPDMTALEQRFDTYPTLTRYAIDGIYETADVEVAREGALTLLYADGTEWRYTLPEGGTHSFLVKAPAEAVVTVNGAALTDAELAATSIYPTRLDVPAALLSSLPGYRIYAAGGLYTAPEISAALPDGTPLVAETAPDGSIAYTLGPSDALYEANHGRVEEFLRALCEYGAGHTARYAPIVYVAHGSPLSAYITRASGSLYWTVGVATNYTQISSSEYIPLGADAFLCKGQVVCSTQTRFQTVNFDLNYDMLWVRQGTAWMVQDLAFAKYEAKK